MTNHRIVKKQRNRPRPRGPSRSLPGVCAGQGARSSPYETAPPRGRRTRRSIARRSKRTNRNHDRGGPWTQPRTPFRTRSKSRRPSGGAGVRAASSGKRNGADEVVSRSERGLAATPGLIAPTGFLSILRKEVIQPQVPLRLPCYDLVPITGFIFGACLSAPTTSDAPRFGGLTGGVYKAQEHIHRGNADPRLLAIPASCGRVAARNPN